MRKVTNNRYMKNNALFKLLVVLNMMVLPMVTYCQTDDNIFEGTYTIKVSSVKQTDLKLSQEHKLEIEENRKENEDFLLRFDEFSILIMSREKMEADLKWPKYSLKEK